MFTPAIFYMQVELHRRELLQEAQREQLARLASQQSTASNPLDWFLSSIGDLLISAGRRLKEQHPVDAVPHWRLPVDTQAESRIIKV